MKPALIFTVGFSAFFSSTAMDAAGDPSLQDLKRVLVEKYQLTTPELATALTVLGTSVQADSGLESRLVRWIDGPRRLAVVVTGDALEETKAFATRFGLVMSKIGRHTGYCAQTIQVDPDGSYRPSLAELNCLQKPYDVLMVVDASIVVPRKLFEDLRERAQSPSERDKWDQRAKAESAFFTHTGCWGNVAIDQSISAITSGSAYFRVVRAGSDARNRSLVDVCIDVLPFLILGQRATRTTGTEMTYVEEMLQLFYSPDFHAGMTKSEILRLLEN